jgi:hypothetical protein
LLSAGMEQLKGQMKAENKYTYTIIDGNRASACDAWRGLPQFGSMDEAINFAREHATETELVTIREFSAAGTCTAVRTISVE